MFSLDKIYVLITMTVFFTDKRAATYCSLSTDLNKIDDHITFDIKVLNSFFGNSVIKIAEVTVVNCNLKNIYYINYHTLCLYYHTLYYHTLGLNLKFC